MAGREELVENNQPESNFSLILEIPGAPGIAIGSLVIPPVGTRIQVHKHATADGVAVVVEVIDHEWRVREATVTESGLAFIPDWDVIIKTRIVL